MWKLRNLQVELWRMGGTSCKGGCMMIIKQVYH